MLSADARRLVTALLLMKFFQNAALAVVPPLLAHLSGALALSPTQVGSVVGAFGISRLLIGLPLGLYLSRVSRAVRLVWIGLALTLAGTVLFGAASAYVWLLVGRTLVGIGHGTVYLACLVLILHVCPHSHVGRVINIWEAVGVASLVVHAFLGGLVADYWSWRAAFAWAAASVAVSGVMLALGMRGTSGAVQGEVIREERTDSPGAGPGPAGRGSVYALVLMTTFTLSVCWTGILTTLIPLYGGTVLKLRASQIGAVLAVAYLVDIALLFPAGRVMDRSSRTVLVAPALVILIVGVLLLPHVGSLLTYLGVAAFFATGLVIWNVPSALVADLRLGPRQGFVLGLVRVAGDVATFLAPVVLGYLVERGGYQAASWSVAGLVAGNLLLALVERGRRRVGLPLPASPGAGAGLSRKASWPKSS